MGGNRVTAKDLFFPSFALHPGQGQPPATQRDDVGRVMIRGLTGVRVEWELCGRGGHLPSLTR
jgi:hypothetical protein